MSDAALTLAAAPPQSPSDDSLGMDADVRQVARTTRCHVRTTDNRAANRQNFLRPRLLVVDRRSGRGRDAPDVVEELLALQALTVQIVNAAARIYELTTPDQRFHARERYSVMAGACRSLGKDALNEIAAMSLSRRGMKSSPS